MSSANGFSSWKHACMTAVICAPVSASVLASQSALITISLSGGTARIASYTPWVFALGEIGMGNGNEELPHHHPGHQNSR